MITINEKIRTELVEVVIANTTSNEFILGQLPNLRNAKAIHKIETFRTAQVSKTPSGKTVANDTVFFKSFLVLIAGDTQIRQIPLVSLNKNTNGTSVDPVHTQTIDPEKSKIFIGELTGLVAGEAFLLQITYEKK